MSQTYRLAPMSRLFALLTGLLWLLPVAFTLAAFSVPRCEGLIWGAVFLVAGYAGVWLWMRPSAFELTSGALSARFPGRTRAIQRSSLGEARLVERGQLREQLGWAVRIGVGGLWGGFGWLWTTRRGLVEFYISRLDGLVWIERPDGRPLLITPESPEALVADLSAR